MAKITEYPAATSFDSGDILIKDGTNGTKKISVDDASVNFIEIANQTVDSSLIPTIDDCVLITNDTDGVRKMLVSDISGNAHSRELTYSQYQALSNAEKTNGTTYYVTNDPNDRVSGGIDYSTTEQDTGLKWIDGKPIYQKTFIFNQEISINYSAWTNLGIVNTDIDVLIDAIAGDYGYGGAQNRGVTWGCIDVSKVVHEGYLSALTSRNGDSIQIDCLTIHYTKTTDTV